MTRQSDYPIGTFIEEVIIEIAAECQRAHTKARDMRLLVSRGGETDLCFELSARSGKTVYHVKDLVGCPVVVNENWEGSRFEIVRA